MAVSPEVLLDAAAALGSGNSEVDWRNATSRAYYAAYHSCASVARAARLNVAETGSVHATLIAATGGSGRRQLFSPSKGSAKSCGYGCSNGPEGAARLTLVISSDDVKLEFPI